MENYFNWTQYCLQDSLKLNPQKTALIWAASDQTQSWTYQEMGKEIWLLAGKIAGLGLKPQSCVVICLPTSPEYAFVFFAILLAGFIAVPVSIRSPKEEIKRLIRDSRSELIISKDLFHPKCITIEMLKAGPSDQFFPTYKEDPAILVYTSGTTKHSKGVLHAHRMILIRKTIQETLLNIQSQDVVLHSDEMHFTYTFGILFDGWSVGATCLLFQGSHTAHLLLSLINRFQVTLFASTPSTYIQMIADNDFHKFSLKSLKRCISAGDLLEEHVREEWLEKTHIPIYNAFGMTEVNLFISEGPNIPHKKGRLGKIMPGRKVVILSQTNHELITTTFTTGFLAVHRSEIGLMLGYWHCQKEEQEHYRDDWFLTGDLVQMDEEGYIIYQGRLGNVLNIDSELVSPAEVESVFKKYPGIQEVGCWAVTNSYGLLELALFIIPVADHKIDGKSLLQYAKEHLSEHKRPKHIYLVKKLPRDVRGKLIRRQLLALIPSSKDMLA